MLGCCNFHDGVGIGGAKVSYLQILRLNIFVILRCAMDVVVVVNW